MGSSVVLPLAQGFFRMPQSNWKDENGNSRRPQRTWLAMPVMGMESEFNVWRDEVEINPETYWKHPKAFIDTPLLEREKTSSQIPTGGAVYFDRGAIEVVTPDRAHGPQPLGADRLRARPADALGKKRRAHGPAEGVQHALQHLVRDPGQPAEPQPQHQEAGAAARLHPAGAGDGRGGEPALDRRRRPPAQQPDRDHRRLHAGSWFDGGDRDADRRHRPRDHVVAVVRPLAAEEVANPGDRRRDPRQAHDAEGMADERLPLPAVAVHVGHQRADLDDAVRR